jgi:hypothetical protein
VDNFAWQVETASSKIRKTAYFQVKIYVCSRHPDDPKAMADSDQQTIFIQ